jgi:hypothetical protein
MLSPAFRNQLTALKCLFIKSARKARKKEKTEKKTILVGTIQSARTQGICSWNSWLPDLPDHDPGWIRTLHLRGLHHPLHLQRHAGRRTVLRPTAAVLLISWSTCMEKDFTL